MTLHERLSSIEFDDSIKFDDSFQLDLSSQDARGKGAKEASERRLRTRLDESPAYVHNISILFVYLCINRSGGNWVSCHGKVASHMHLPGRYNTIHSWTQLLSFAISFSIDFEWVLASISIPLGKPFRMISYVVSRLMFARIVDCSM